MPLFRPLTQSDLKERLGYAVLHYSFYDLTTLSETGRPPKPSSADPLHTRRRRRDLGDRPANLLLAHTSRSDFLDPQRTYTILIKAA